VTDITPTPDNQPQPENAVDIIDPHLETEFVSQNVAFEPAAKPAKNDDTVTLPRTTLNYVIIALTFFMLGIGLGAVYFGGSAEVDEEQIGMIVRELLVEAELLHPFVEDMNALADDDPYIGSVDAPITMIEFSAYACPYCGRHFNTTLTPILENYGQYIRYIYRDHPIINQDISFPASLAANCARQQNQFWEYHTTLFENQTLLGPSYFLQVAEDLGMDMEVFQTCYQEETTADEVINDYNDASALNITGTPSFYINGSFHSGAQSYEYFEAVILQELSELGINP
jgi:hypothetical protein